MPTKNNLVLSCFLCDYEVKIKSKNFAKDRNMSFGKLINRALIWYIAQHREEVVVERSAPKPLLCQIGDCKEVSFASGVLKQTGKTYRLCTIHASLFRKDESLNKIWVIA